MRPDEGRHLAYQSHARRTSCLQVLNDPDDMFGNMIRLQADRPCQCYVGEAMRQRKRTMMAPAVSEQQDQRPEEADVIRKVEPLKVHAGAQQAVRLGETHPQSVDLHGKDDVFYDVEPLNTDDQQEQIGEGSGA